jgi:RNA polymerase sigma factor (sigma-70 family)
MTDQTLIQKVIEGDLPSVRLLVENNRNLIWHIIVSMTGHNKDSEDLFQDVFLRVFKYSKNFKGQSKLSTWIGSIAHHVCIDYLRRRKIETGIWNHDQDEKTIAGIQAEMNWKASEKEDINRIVLQAITKLPADYRTVITLYHLEECPYKDIAEITGMPEGTVKSYISRGRNLLREILTGIVPDLAEILSDY